MRVTSLIWLVCSALALPASAAKPTFQFKPPPDEERPVIVRAIIGPQGSDYALQLHFDREPWGDACKNRCANATLLLDLDASAQTGLQLGKGAAENGADLAVVVQGSRQYADDGGQGVLRVKVIELPSGTTGIDEGETLAELDHRRDADRVLLDGTTLFLLVDVTSATLPSARKARVVYRPPGHRAIVASMAGLGSGASKGKARIFRDGDWGRAR